MSTNSLILLSPEVELNFSPLEYGLNLVTYFQRIEYGKKKITQWKNLALTMGSRLRLPVISHKDITHLLS